MFKKENKSNVSVRDYLLKYLTKREVKIKEIPLD